MLDGENGVLITTAEASLLYRRPQGTIRRWAKEDGWRPFGSRHRRRWQAEQVQASYDRRAGTDDSN